jgi:hypothetical protein
MPRVIAVSLDDKRWLAAAAQVKGERFTVERWLEGTFAEENSLGTALDTAGFSRDPVWVAIDRGRVELRSQRFPPLPDEELPLAVRMQAMQQSSADRLLCDFLTLRRDDRGVDVLVASCGGEISDGISKKIAPLKLERLALRPLCSAAWLSHSQASKSMSGIFAMKSDPGTTMLIDARAGEAEFILFRDRRPVFLRSVRLPDHPTGIEEVLSAEARRSLLASGVSEALGGQPPTAVIWGDGKTSERTMALVQQSIGGSVRMLHPTTTRPDLNAPPASADVSSVAAIFGLLYAGASKPHWLIDLQQPRKPPAPPSKKRTYALLGCAVAAAVVSVGYSFWKPLADQKSKLAELQETSRELKETEADSLVNQKKLKSVEEFTVHQFSWLDRLAEISETAPAAKTLLVESIEAKLGGKQPTIGLTGLVTDPLELDEMQNKLNSMGHRVSRDSQKSVMNSKIKGFNDTVKLDMLAETGPRKEVPQ